MDLLDYPVRIPLKWAASAAAPYINAIPEDSQIGITNGAASFTDGFPPLNFVQTESGGYPPRGADFNGILQQLSAGLQWQQAGGPTFFNSTFSTDVGGYPAGAMVQSATTVGLFYISLVDDNTDDPAVDDTNWASAYIPGTGYGVEIFGTAGVDTFTVPAGITRCRVRVWGAGGGGGGSDAGPAAGSGGGAGGYAEGIFTLVPGQVVTVTIGAGGGGGSAAHGDGAAGGTSSFGGFCSATGGGPGLGASGAVQTDSGDGGNGTGAQLVLQGQGGATAYSLGAAGVVSGYGGAAPLNGPSFPGTGSNPGTGGFSPGGGGSGSSTLVVGGQVGGDGADGLVIVEYWG